MIDKTTYREAAALHALKAILDPVSGQDMVSAGLLGDMNEKDGYVRAVIIIDPAKADIYEPVRKAAQEALSELAGVSRAIVVMSAHKAAPKVSAPPPSGPPSGAPSGRGVPKHQAKRAQGVQGDALVKTVFAVSSAKGGVGKSTVAVNLAAALSKQGHKVGVLDADIHGPSLPRLLGLTGERADADNSHGRMMIKPLQAHGLKAMSVAFLTPDEGPVVWRGPMVQGMIAKMLYDVNWGELDYLIIDMPPGTGDAQLGLAQDIKPKAAIIVSTPQDLALSDTRKGMAMFEKVGVPLAGLVENMSVFICPSCNQAHDLFGTGGAKDMAGELGVTFLGSAPLHMDVRRSADAGAPIALGDNAQAQIFADIARASEKALAAV